MARGDGTIYQQKDGMWAGAIELPPHGGKRRRKVVRRKTERQVKVELKKLRLELAQRGDITTSGITVEQWINYWLDEIAAKRVVQSSLKTYRNHLSKHVGPHIGLKKRLDKITPRDLRSIETYYISEGYASSHASVAFAVTKLSLKDAVREGRIPSNPADLVEAPRIKKADREALTPEEAVKVLEHAAGDRLGACWAMSILTGARRNEVLGLTIDRVTDEIDLSWQLQRLDVDDKGRPSDVPADFEYRELADQHGKSRYFWTRPKSSSGWRVIPLVDPLKSILERHITSTPDNKHGLVFTNNGRPISPDQHSKNWRKLLKAAGINRDVVLHGARHTTVDLLYMAGVPEDLIQEIVGHSTRGMTRRYKSKGNSVRLTEAMQRMSALVPLTQRDGQASQSGSE